MCSWHGGWHGGLGLVGLWRVGEFKFDMSAVVEYIHGGLGVSVQTGSWVTDVRSCLVYGFCTVVMVCG